MKKIAPVLILLLVLGAVYYFYFRRETPRKEGVIPVSGNIEITDAALSFKIPGRVTERFVDEGQEVKQGQIVAKLDGTDLQKEVELREAQIEVAKAALRDLEAGSRPEEIEKAEAAVAKAKAEESRWQKEYERQQGLFQKDVISERELETSRLSYQTSQADLREAEEALKLLRKGSRVEQIEERRAQLRQSEKELALAQTTLSYATIYSPLNGIVISKSVEPGEYVSAGTPIVTVGKMDDVWLRAYINETDLGRVRVGQTVNIRTDSFPGKTYPGRISFISSQSEFTPKSVQTEKERVKLVYRIKVDIPNQERQLKPGMPSDGEILVSRD